MTMQSETAPTGESHRLKIGRCFWSSKSPGRLLQAAV